VRHPKKTPSDYGSLSVLAYTRHARSSKAYSLSLEGLPVYEFGVRISRHDEDTPIVISSASLRIASHSAAFSARQHHLNVLLGVLIILRAGASASIIPLALCVLVEGEHFSRDR
jgi:hypothetical protein